MSTETTFTPRGDFNEGVFYPNTFSDEEKASIKHNDMFWLALEIFTQSQGRVLISGRVSEGQRLQLATREGFHFGSVYAETVDSERQYCFKGAMTLKERGKDRWVLSSKKAAYLNKKVREVIKSNMEYAYRKQLSGIRSTFNNLNNQILATRHISADLGREEEIAALQALYSGNGLHAIDPKIEASLKAKYLSMVDDMKKQQDQLQECAGVFTDGAWVIGAGNSNVIIGDCHIAYNPAERCFEIQTASLRQYASLNAVENEIREPLKLSLVMLKAHMKSVGRPYDCPKYDEDQLFPVADNVYKEYGATMYCNLTTPSNEDRQWMVIAK
jgi:hypothetical protein